MTERSPWRIAFEALAHRNGGASESIALRLNAKGGVQPEVTAVPKDTETLEEAAQRAESVFDGLLTKYARLDTPFGPGPTAEEAEAAAIEARMAARLPLPRRPKEGSVLEDV